ncbi:MAG: hypothetical protein Q4D65_00025 [Peptostreptococcaceae bacterium]|nr:hypothetical protein [Peptostreptococcaceae bacterium]
MKDTKWKEYVKRLFWLNNGFIICALGVVFILASNTGYAPWDVLSSGLSKTLKITIGQAIILVSVVLVVVEYFAGSSIGVGTLLNMVMIGAYIDLIRKLDIINPGENYAIRLLFLLIGTIVLNFGIWMYMAQALGSGPRDGLMVVLAKKTGISIGIIKIINEVIAVGIGYLLGGSFGLGTVLIALFSGPLLKKQFDMLGFDATKVKHEYLTDYIKWNKKS